MNDNNNYFNFVGTNYKKEKEDKIFLRQNGELNDISMYQICLFENPLTKKHKIRRIVIDYQGNFICVNEYEFKKKYVDKLKSDVKDNQMLCYATFNLKNIEYPSMSEYLMAKSSVFNTKNTLDDYYNDAM
jgi:hypothetical protein